MKGIAETIDTSGDKKSTLSNASITSCPLLDPDWLLSADEIRLDHADEYGSADDVVLRFKDVPVFYTPYIEFPTSNKRRSGILFPDIGVSSSRGVEFALPWYWNIAPNQDATITPRYMVKRGIGINGDYRYLTQSTSGRLDGDFVPDDDITHEDRYHVRYQQHTRIMSNLLLDIDLDDISDSNYFNDYSNTLGTTSQTHLNRYATLNYALTNWQLKALLQDIKTIDTSIPVSDHVYKRQPQITFNGGTEIADSSFLFNFDSEIVDFEHDDENKTTGYRLTLQPAISLPLSDTAWFINPKVKFSHTGYDVGTEAGTSQSVENFNIPVSSIDAGLFFERDLDNGYLQTLEPRLYYLYVPYVDQSNAPVFDTTAAQFSVSQFFRDNRFVGGDRIGDANQLTFALSSHILNPDSGDVILGASIGQIFYFSDRKVSLNNTVETAKTSEIIAELDSQWGSWKGDFNIQWNTEFSKTSKENYTLHYLSGPRHIFNIGYRKQLKTNGAIDFEQTDTSFVYGITNQFSAYARWNYSLDDKKAIDSILGIAYDSCCWSVQLTAQRLLKNQTVQTLTTTTEYDNAILVQFAFKGLGNVANSGSKKLLEQSIFGYTDIYQ
jgi:LPS-assembly protein